MPQRFARAPHATAGVVRYAARPRLLCIATILMYPTTLTLAALGWRR